MKRIGSTTCSVAEKQALDSESMYKQLYKIEKAMTTQLPRVLISPELEEQLRATTRCTTGSTTGRTCTSLLFGTPVSVSPMLPWHRENGEVIHGVVMTEEPNVEWPHA